MHHPKRWLVPTILRWRVRLKVSRYRAVPYRGSYGCTMHIRNPSVLWVTEILDWFGLLRGPHYLGVTRTGHRHHGEMPSICLLPPAFDIQFAIPKVDMSLLSPQGFSHMVEDRAENQDIGGCGFRGRWHIEYSNLNVEDCWWTSNGWRHGWQTQIMPVLERKQ